MVYNDGRHTVFLSTKGTNKNDVPQELSNFLDYVGSCDNLSQNDTAPNGKFAIKCSDKVKLIKASREIGGRYMMLEEILKNEFNAGKAEGKLEFINTLLASKGLSEDSINSVLSYFSSAGKLDSLFKLAISADSKDQLESLLKNL